jgi:hypothetical protein
VLALEPADGNTSVDGIQFAGLVNASDATVAGGPDLTLSTSNATVPADYDLDPVTITGEYPPDGATVAPGIVVDLKDCTGSCNLITTQDNDPIATLSAVQLNSTQSSMVLFQIRNIPDCRYRLADDPADPLCADYRDAVIGPSGEPGRQYLDVARMLPPEVTAQFPATDTLPPGLPPMLISPQYRGQAAKGYIFGALFAIPGPGVVFKETFEADFDVAALTGSELGCESPGTTLLHDLLQWDVVTRVSERYIAPGGPYGLAATVPDPDSGVLVPNKLRYVDTIVNSGCGTTKSKIGSFSLIAYDLEIAHNPVYGPGGDDQDDVFARLVVKLFDELKLTQTQLACPSGVDRAASPTAPASDPLTDAQCSTLNSVLLNAEDKLSKCVQATQQPKTSAVDQNCQAFDSQFSSYRSQLNAIPPASATLDPANRIGELKARAETLWLVHVERFLPSVPLGGYTPLPQQ